MSGPAGVWRAPEDHEAIREAMLDGRLTPEQALEAWPADDPRLPLMRATFALFGEYEPAESQELDDCDAAIERASDAVDGLAEAGPERSGEVEDWRAPEVVPDSGFELDRDWP